MPPRPVPPPRGSIRDTGEDRRSLARRADDGVPVGTARSRNAASGRRARRKRGMDFGAGVLAFAIALATLWTGCLVEPDAGPPPASAPTINGTRETGMREVAAVARLDATGSVSGLCSSTVIGPYAVLTAKHCVFDESDQMVRPEDLLVVVGHDISSAAGVEKTVRAYDVRTTAGSNVADDVMQGNDIAILLLREDIGVPEREVARSGPSVDATVTIVGFGRTSSSSEAAGVKYRGVTRVSNVDGRLIETSGGMSSTCQGDSGGPLFDGRGRVAGITSFGVGGCSTTNRAYYTRTVNHLSMIDGAVSFVPPCEPEAEHCDGVDNDCDGVVDNGCTALGQACTGDGECSMGRCDDVGGSRLCVRDCDPRHAIPRCPFGFYCEVTGCGAGRCIAGSPGAKGAGEECSSDAECESSHCLEVNGTLRCGRACSPEGEPCGAAELTCEAPADGCGSCVPVELSTGPRSFGAPCDADSQCVSSTCREGFCTRPCGEGEPCPSEFHCRSNLCVRGDLGGPGAPCFTEEDCDPELASECIDADEERMCAQPCGDAGTCSTPGLECAPASSGTYCLPPGLPLGAECAANGECRTGICAGVCTRLCDGATPCPEGYECRAAGEASGCFAINTGEGTGRGGCAVAMAPGDMPPMAMGLIGLFAFWARWVRRGRSRR